MLIGVDGNEANVKTRVGVSVYTLKLLEYFHQQSSPSLQFIIFLKNPPLNDLPLGNKNFSYQVVRGKFLWSQFFLPWFLLRNHFSSSKIDVFFSPAHYAPRFIFCPLVTTVHDLSYFYYPTEFLKKDLYQLKNWTGYSVKKSQKIICVSQSTKKDLQHYYHIPENKIQVIYNGFEKNIASPKTKINLNLPQQKYLLYVGTIQPRKNILTLVRAFGNFQTKYPDFKLVIVGKKGWLWQDIYQAINQVDYKEKIILTGFLDDYNLSILYSHAFCLVLPSFYEGFGIPVLEALS
jgi:glycosyltransferase involved in cell wall biosynthesis